MLPLRSILSALVVAAYLAAVFVPCEPALVFVDWTGGDTAHPVAAAPASSSHSTGTERASRTTSHASHDRSAQASTSSDAHVESARHEHGGAAQQHAAADPSTGAIADEAGSVTPSHGVDGFCELELKPKCLCGCSESRATVGGNVSRLGAAVPAVHVGRLAEVRAPAALDLVLVRARARAPDQDPIPI